MRKRPSLEVKIAPHGVTLTASDEALHVQLCEAEYTLMECPSTHTMLLWTGKVSESDIPADKPQQAAAVLILLPELPAWEH